MEGMTDDQVMLSLYPEIPWREPIEMVCTDGSSGFACRLCIAKEGIKGTSIAELPGDPAYVIEHIRQFHPSIARYKRLN